MKGFIKEMCNIGRILSPRKRSVKALDYKYNFTFVCRQRTQYKINHYKRRKSLREILNLNKKEINGNLYLATIFMRQKHEHFE